MRGKRLTIVYRILVILLIVVIYENLNLFLGIFDVPKLKTSDLFARLKYKLKPLPAACKDIVIVSIDDEAYERFGKKWPWGREVFASLVCKLHRYSPKVIGIDLAFVGETSQQKEADILLAQAFKDVGNVVIASYFSQTDEYIYPYRLFTDSVAGYGFTNKPLDKDSAVRRIKLVSLSESKTIIDYAFEIKIISASLGLPPEEINLAGNGIIPINYSAKSNDFKMVSILGVLRDEVDGSLFRDKIILVGITGEGFQDSRPTPIGILPGVVIIANGIVMLLEKSFVQEVHPLISLSVLVIFALISGLTFFKSKVFKGIIWMAFFIAFFCFISTVLIMNNILWDFFSVPIVILLMYPIINFYKYARLIMETISLKRLVITDPLTGLFSYKYFQLKLHLDLEKAVKEGEVLSIVFFEVGGLGQVTASLGSEKVDDIIVELAKLMQKHSRKTRGLDLIGRYGENGFRVILHNTTHEGAMNYAQRICRIVTEHEFLGKEKARIFLIAGISAYPYIETRSPVALIKCAESALSRARDATEGKVCVYTPELDKVPLEEYEIEEAISPETDLGFVASDLEEKNKELVKAISRLRSAQEELIKMERVSAMGKITAQIHHELNNPLHNLGSFLETIEKKGRWDSEAKEFINLALKEINRMKKLSHEMRDFYKPIRREMVDTEINIILDDMLKMSKKQLEGSNVKVVKDFDPNLPKAKGNTEELKQIFLNMIINAADAMLNGGILTITTRIAPKKPTMIEILIKDTGCGIAPENMGKIFRPFFTTKGDTRGTGLGLYACSEIVKRHGGKIEVESQPNVGTVFKIYLPIGGMSTAK